MSATPIPANGAPFSPQRAVQATGGTLAGPTEWSAAGVCIDSRRVHSGNIFVALRGARHDGHRHLASALEAGARAVVVDRQAADDSSVRAILDSARAGVVVVADTRRALGDLAAAHRRDWAGRLVAVTGSVGKTTTKELIYASLVALGAEPHRTSGNLNNDIGVPMTLFGLSPQHRSAVVELGTSARGEIERLAEIANADCGLVTAAALAHAEGLGGVEDIAHEKCALLRRLGPDGKAVVNGDNEALMRELQRNPLPVPPLLFGSQPGVHVRLTGHKIAADLTTSCVFETGHHKIQSRLRLLGGPAAISATAALAVLVACGFDLRTGLRGMESVETTAGRLCPVRVGTHWLIDDTYNASPRSMQLALETAAEAGRVLGQPWAAVLGDMKELGAISASAHEELGQHLAKLKPSLAVLYGDEIVPALESVRRVDPSVQVVHVHSTDDIVDTLRSEFPASGVILLKGSRAMQLDRVVDRLAAEAAS